MKTKHTPAPWEYQGGDNASVEVNIGETTASIDRIDKNTGQYVISRDEMCANAKLIAAAPDLLEALQEYVNLEQGHISKLTTTPAERLAKAIAAIKKATE